MFALVGLPYTLKFLWAPLTDRFGVPLLGRRRGWLQRLAGLGTHTELAWRDARSLRLPQSINAFDDTRLNRDLYFWLAALAACEYSHDDDWFTHSQALTRRTLRRYPGLAARYRRLCQAHLARRPDPQRLPANEARREQAILYNSARRCEVHKLLTGEIGFEYQLTT